MRNSSPLIIARALSHIVRGVKSWPTKPIWKIPNPSITTAIEISTENIDVPGSNNNVPFKAKTKGTMKPAAAAFIE